MTGRKYSPKKRPGAVRFGKTSGYSPGTPVFVGERKLEKARIDILNYSADRIEEKQDATLDSCLRLKDWPGVTWINVNGIHDIDLTSSLAERFGFHSLTTEDIVNTMQRSKVEDFGTYIFVVLKMITCREADQEIDIEHISLLFGEGFVMSFLEDEGDVFEDVRQRLRSAKGRIRRMKSDYLAYSLMDAVVDNYFLALEKIGDRIEAVDEEIFFAPRPEHMRDIHRLKRSMLSLRRAVWPLREEIGIIEKSESPLIDGGTRVFLRDLYDHTIQVIDMVESGRDMLAGMHDTYLSTVSNRLNEIMKVLTIISTVFIPLTFIVGVYGMNFEYMPELKWPWGYFLVWGVMAVVVGGMIGFLRRRKWL